MKQSKQSGERDFRRMPWIKIAAATFIIVLLTATIIAFKNLRVCDQQVGPAGQVVEVCRHLSMTDPPVLAGVVALVVALAAFFTEIGAFGISLKRDVANAEDAANRAQAAAQNAQGAERSVEMSERVAAKLTPPSSEPMLSPADLVQQFRDLAHRYNIIRQQMPSGSERTERMTDIVAHMISLSNSTEPERLTRITEWIEESDRGLRLAAYAVLYTRPQPARLHRLAEAALREDRPFGQYWALKTLRRHVALAPESLDVSIQQRLNDFLTHLSPTTSRAYELREILRLLQGPASSGAGL